MIFSSLISQSTLHLISFILLATLLSKVDLNESHQCGRISVDTLRKERIIPPSNTRIVGGTPVRPYQYPWMVYVESEYQFQPSSPVNRDHIRSSRSSLLSLSLRSKCSFHEKKKSPHLAMERSTKFLFMDRNVEIISLYGKKWASHVKSVHFYPWMEKRNNSIHESIF